MGHVMMENRHGLAVDTRLTMATGTAEREAALAMAGARPGNRRITVGARQGLRCRRDRRGLARAQRHTACRPEHQQPALGDLVRLPKLLGAAA
jgi:hypothetical protein